MRRSVYRDFPIFSQDSWYRRFGEMLVDGHARPTALIYPEISQQLQLAIGAVVSGDKSPEQALDEAWNAVNAEYARQTSSRSARPDHRRPDRLDPDGRRRAVSGRDLLAGTT